MKKIYHILTLAGVFLFLFSACHEASLVKSEVEADFNINSANAPTITISNPSSVTAKKVTISATVGNISDPSSIIDLGFMYSTESQFASSTIKTLQCTYGSTITGTISVNPNSTYYIKAVAATKDGYAASETVKVETPDVPLIEKLDGAVYGKNNVLDYWEDDAYNIKITLKNIGDNKFLLCDLDPYFFSYGYTYAKGYNYAEGVFDEETLTMIVAGGQPVNYGNTYFSSLDGDIIITFDEQGLTMTFETYWGVHSPEGWWNLFLPLTLNRL